MSAQSLEELAVQSGLISAAQLSAAQRDAALRRRRLPETLIDLGLVSQERFADWIASVSGAPLLDPVPEAEVERLHRRIPRGLAREYGVVPAGLDREELLLGMLNPLDESALQTLRVATGLRLRPAVVRRRELSRLLARYYPEEGSESTILPMAGATMAIPAAGDNSPGSATIALVTAPPPPSQLDRIEKSLADLQSAVSSLQRRLEAMERLLARVSPPE